jgi:hypothetical protein
MTNKNDQTDSQPDSEAGYPSLARQAIDPVLGKPGDHQLLDPPLIGDSWTNIVTPESNKVDPGSLPQFPISLTGGSNPGEIGVPASGGPDTATAVSPLGKGFSSSADEGSDSGAE